VDEIEAREQFVLVRDGMGAWDRISYLTGFCPEERVAVLQAAAKRHGWGLLIRDPGPDEQTPTLLRNALWVQPIKAVFDMLGILPGYREIDVSACFLLFFSLFFAMLVGDAGYGAIFLGLTLLARRKMPKAPFQPFALMIVMSVATMVWGVLTGTYFGIAELPPVLRSLRIDWLTNEDNLKLLCFIIGTVHLMVAHAWNGWLNRRSLQSLAQLGWVGTTLCMFYLSRFMVLGGGLPAFVWPVLGGSVVLIVLFMTPLKAMKDEWFNHVMLPLSLVSNFMDVISYVRLYAVGMASLALAMAFNEMAAGFGVGVGGRIAAVVVLFLGHTLNLVLAGMGVMVHGVRLNALEFSSHIGLSWTGIAFRPFVREGRAAEMK
jgi:V/A-type H+-transporting ATPase subunit I